MTLLPALAAIVILGLTPAGPRLAETCASTFNVPAWACLIVLYLIVIMLGTAPLWFARSVLRPSTGSDAHGGRPRTEPRDDSLIGWLLNLSDNRGQRIFSALLVLTVGLGVVAIVITRPTEPIPFACMIGAAVIGIAPDWVLRGIRRRPLLAPFEPDAPQAPESVGGDLYTYDWTFAPSLTGGEVRSSYQIQLRIPDAVVERFRTADHPRPPEASLAESLPMYVADGLSDEVRCCATEVALKARAEKLPYLDSIDFVLAFVRESIDYVLDHEQYGEREYFAYPIETLVSRAGDCDDHAILAAAILLLMNIDTIFIEVPGHVAIGIAMDIGRPGHFVDFNGRRYYYGEATPSGDWRLGEVPEEYRGRLRAIEIPLG